MAQKEAKTLAELLSVRPSSESTYISNFNPRPMGNTQPISYGGCTIGVAISAAYESVPAGFHAYSLVGNFLGPALIDRPLRCEVRKLRETRTFQTRQVLLTQDLDGGKESRSCLNLVADFQAPEPESVITFSAKPRRQWPSVEHARNYTEIRQRLLEEGKIDERTKKAVAKSFTLLDLYMDTRQLPGSILGETLMGVLKGVKLEQDGLPIPDKTSGDWVRIPHKLGPEKEHVAAMAFVLDGAMSFLPLAHDGRFFGDVGACSSLDFALRFFTNELDFNQFHLRELNAITAGNGRSYNEARVFDIEGNLVAIMTQQGILRPKQPTSSI
jgi:acyl-CoA thioesterase II